MLCMAMIPQLQGAPSPFDKKSGKTGTGTDDRAYTWASLGSEGWRAGRSAATLCVLFAGTRRVERKRTAGDQRALEQRGVRLAFVSLAAHARLIAASVKSSVFLRCALSWAHGFSTYDCLPLGMADFTSGLRQFETYLLSSSANRGSPAFTTSAFMRAVLSSGFCGMKTCGDAHVKSM